jgi:sec-independent protein translocase protein TatA
MFSGLESPMHLVVVLIIAVLVLGPKKLPEVGRSLGSSMRGFKASLAGEEEKPVVAPAATVAPPTAPVVAPPAAAAPAPPAAPESAPPVATVSSAAVPIDKDA